MSGCAGRGIGLSQWNMLPHPPQPGMPRWVGVLVSTQIEQPGSWGPFPFQLGGGAGFGYCKGAGLRGGVGEELPHCGEQWRGCIPRE